METTRDQVLRFLTPLTGLQLSVARRAADMRVFHFGRVRVTEGGSVGDFALHIQCPWRINRRDEILTGRSDLWQPVDADGDVDWDNWDYDTDGNLQDHKLATLLAGYDSRTRSSVNTTDLLMVEGIDADDHGGVTISLSGGYQLVIFPSGSTGEDWRLLGSAGDKHFVVVGGSVEESPTDS
jgi:hypothetical protein